MTSRYGAKELLPIRKKSTIRYTKAVPEINEKRFLSILCLLQINTKKYATEVKAKDSLVCPDIPSKIAIMKIVVLDGFELSRSKA
jgi:hypothetical protein